MSQVLVDDRIAVRVYQTRGNHEPGREELGGKREWLRAGMVVMESMHGELGRQDATSELEMTIGSTT